MERQLSVFQGTKIIAFLMALAMLAMPASAMVEPNPIVVKVLANGHGIEGMSVVVTNDRTSERVVGVTDNNGEFLIDWSNTVYKHEVGDAFTISAGEKTKHITYVGSVIGIISFDYTGECIVTKCPEPVVCEVCAEPIVCPEPVICPKPVECEECPELPDDMMSKINAIIGMILALAVGSGIGFTVSRDKDGKLRFSWRTHKHYGREYLHSVYRVHCEPYTHGYGEPAPIYKDGKYVPNPDFPKK